jgi:hypothetical protein
MTAPMTGVLSADYFMIPIQKETGSSERVRALGAAIEELVISPLRQVVSCVHCNGAARGA